MQELFALGLQDVFRKFEQPEETYSRSDSRAARFRRNHGLRIDLALTSAACAGKCDACHIDKTPRTGNALRTMHR